MFKRWFLISALLTPTLLLAACNGPWQRDQGSQAQVVEFVETPGPTLVVDEMRVLRFGDSDDVEMRLSLRYSIANLGNSTFFIDQSPDGTEFDNQRYEVIAVASYETFAPTENTGDLFRFEDRVVNSVPLSLAPGGNGEFVFRTIDRDDQPIGKLFIDDMPVGTRWIDLYGFIVYRGSPYCYILSTLEQRFYWNYIDQSSAPNEGLYIPSPGAPKTTRSFNFARPWMTDCTKFLPEG